MKHLLVPVLLSLVATTLPTHAWADQRSDDRRRDRRADDIQRRSDQRRGDQYDAYQARRSGTVLSLREIEGRVIPSMRGASYLGPEFDQSSGVYRLKFMRQGNVVWVDIDGRTGAVIGRSGN